MRCLQCGPRFDMKLYQIKLGTMDQSHVENEWVLRAYTRSAKKAKLSDDKVDRAAVLAANGHRPA